MPLGPSGCRFGLGVSLLESVKGLRVCCSQTWPARRQPPTGLLCGDYLILLSKGEIWFQLDNGRHGTGDDQGSIRIHAVAPPSMPDPTGGFGHRAMSMAGEGCDGLWWWWSTGRARSPRWTKRCGHYFTSRSAGIPNATTSVFPDGGPALRIPGLKVAGMALCQPLVPAL